MDERTAIVWIIRFDRKIKFPSGNYCYICSFMGTKEEVAAYAKDLARQNKAVVKAII
ncbi:MAG: hypothetical protein Q4B26_04750 [Eubacteriales bacterium]|nr:hypothetical protein [Eubacteriales bacterium]